MYYIDVEGGATPDLIESMGYSDIVYSAETNPVGMAEESPKGSSIWKDILLRLASKVS